MTFSTSLPSSFANIQGTILAQSAFCGNGPLSRRYLWDPVVHEEFGEQCYFAFLTLPKANESTLQTIQTIAWQHEISSVMAYLVFGGTDCVVRVWAEKDDFGHFQQALESTIVGAKVDPFEALSVDYTLWAPQDLGLVLIDSFRSRRDIEVVSRGSNPQEVSGALERLVSSKLVHFLDPAKRVDMGPSGILCKVYIGLVHLQNRTRIGAPLPGASLMPFQAEIRTRIREITGLQMCSVYFGRGSYQCLVKGLFPVEELQLLPHWLFALEDSLDEIDVRVRTETMIVACDGLPERDLVPAEHRPRGQEARVLRSIVRPDRGARLQGPGAISRELHDVILRVFGEWGYVALESPFQLDFIRLLEAGLAEDKRELWRAITFALLLEGDFLKFFNEELIPTILNGREQVAPALKEALRKWIEGRVQARSLTADDELPSDLKHDIDLGKSAVGKFLRQPTNLALGECSMVLQVLVQSNTVDRQTIGALAGENWSDWIEHFRTLRNLAGHSGSITESKTPFPELWREVAELSARVITQTVIPSSQV
jgi:hypothetical protein